MRSRRKEMSFDEQEWGSSSNADSRKYSMDTGPFNALPEGEPMYLPPGQPNPNGEKCYPLLIGGTILQQGLTTSSMKPMSCSTLRCFNCDKKVHRFVNASWTKDVDYLFVRNNNTNLLKLQQGVEFNQGSSAYACQCKFITVIEPTNSSLPENMKWMCGGH